MAGKLQKSYFEVLGLCCATEVPLVEETLKPLNGVQTISVILPTKTVIVFHDSSLISQSKIVEALNKARLEASVRPQGEIMSESKWPAPATMVCGILLALSFLKYVYEPLQWLALVAVAVGLPPVLGRSLASIRNLTFNINILVALAVGGTIALQDYAEAASVVFLYSISTWLESKASHQARATMSTLTSMSPQKATIAKTGEQVDVNVVPLNTVLAVKVGDAIPIDGIVVDGECEVDEKALTGESFPVGKQLGSTVWAGTINVNGYISVRTTALAKDCVVARMAMLVEEAHSKKSKAERLIDSFSKYYIPAVLLISAGLAAIPAALRVHHQSYWFRLALVFLVSACPCALIISTPVTIFCALSKAATTGLLVKGGDYLEILAKIQIMAFDKTGTLTKGEFVVTEFCSIHDKISLETLLYWVSSVESKSSHPMAAALIEYARSNSVEPEYKLVEDFQNYPGEGVYGKIAGNSIYIGNWKIGYRAGSNAGALANFHGWEGKTNGYVFLEGTVVGIFSLSDGCRSGAMKAIKELKSLGIKTAMLTGDTESAATLAQDQLDQALDEVYAGLLPEDKARIIENFKKEGPTAMVGDGINDALALALADIGISMGISGSALAMETGNIILLSNDIQKIPKSIQLARRSFNKLVQNVIIPVVMKGAVLALAFAGYPLVWAAVVTDVGTCLIVILNSMLLLQDTKKGEGKSPGSQYGTFSCSGTKAETILPVYNQCSNGCCEKPSQDVASGSRQQQKSKGKRWNFIGGKECKKTKRCNDGCCDRSVTYHMVSGNEQDSASNRSRSDADSSCSSSFKNQSQ